jgi:hypothetical protein
MGHSEASVQRWAYPKDVSEGGHPEMLPRWASRDVKKNKSPQNLRKGGQPGM